MKPENSSPTRPEESDWPRSWSWERIQSINKTEHKLFPGNCLPSIVDIHSGYQSSLVYFAEESSCYGRMEW
jgi:hypothetical protein